MQGADLDLFHSVILARLPELEGLPCRALTESWDSVALDVGDRVILKFPRDEEAALALAREARTLTALRGQVTLPIPDMTLHAGPPMFSSHPKIPGQHLPSLRRTLKLALRAGPVGSHRKRGQNDRRTG